MARHGFRSRGSANPTRDGAASVHGDAGVVGDAGVHQLTVAGLGWKLIGYAGIEEGNRKD